MIQDFNVVTSLLKIPFPVLALSAFCIAAIVSFYAYPVIIYVAHRKQLMDVPGDRSVHQRRVPTLGGVGVFIGFCVALTFLGFAVPSLQLISLLGSLILLFFIGVEDDLLVISPRKKFVVQLIAALHVILVAGVRINSFFGLFGVHTLPYWFSVVFSLFVFVLIINAYNLIDGIDGLAGGLGLSTSIFFAVFFLFNGEQGLALISLALIGALCSFLYYNFSNKRKIFMGDTGSLLIGFLLAFQGISFLKEQAAFPTYYIVNAPVFVLAVLSFPFIDTLRVFLVRVLKGRSPFLADKNHIHHRLLILGFKHWQITVMVAVFGASVVCVAFVTRSLDIHWQLFLVIVYAILLALSPFFVSIKNKKIKLLKTKQLLKK